MHAITQELDAMLDCLDPQSAARLEQAVREAVSQVRAKANESKAVDAMGYPLGYFEAIPGSFRDEPLDPPADLPLETRKAW